MNDMVKGVEASYEEWANNLERLSDNYKVLRRLPPLTGMYCEEPGKLYKGLFTDVETTGLNVVRDEIIELGAIPFSFNHAGLLISFGEPFHGYNQPGKKISSEITALTGISPEVVKGHKLDIGAADAFFDVDLIIAHNAEFDRQMIERYLPNAAKKCWACSSENVPWKDHGYGTKALKYLLMEMGWFYKAHNAISDCEAALMALQHAVGGRLAFQWLLESARSHSWKVWAVDSPYKTKDALKDRKYRWNDGEDGRLKAWSKEIPSDKIDEETAWLERAVYRGKSKAVIKKVSAFDRFSVRG